MPAISPDLVARPSDLLRISFAKMNSIDDSGHPYFNPLLIMKNLNLLAELIVVVVDI